jgi:hypothetical protein
MKRDGIRLGYHLSMEKGPTFRPTAFHFWKDLAHFEKTPPQNPSQYMSDMLLGVSFLKLNSYCASPLALPQMNHNLAHDVWTECEPHRGLFYSSQKRAQALHKELRPTNPEKVKKFEAEFTKKLDSFQKPWGFDLTDFSELVLQIEEFEASTGNPLIYSFKTQFSKNFEEKLLALDSFLFHLRSVVALDYNTHIQEHAFEGLKVDSVQDYLPRADYVVRDALLYHQFKKWSLPWSQGPKSDVRVEKLFIEPMTQAFKKHVHNACFLIDQLPESFVSGMGPQELEEALYLVQMDWLMGTGSGLLFKIREEIYGLVHGYEKVFWHEHQDRDWSQPTQLRISCEMSESSFRKKAA